MPFRVQFEGSDAPSFPVNWRVAESTSALHALIAALTTRLLEKKYNVVAPNVAINTDHAVLYPSSLYLWTIDPDNDNLTARMSGRLLAKYICDTDLHRRVATKHRAATSGLYKCADGKWFQLHGSLNPDPVLDVLGLPREREVESTLEARQLFQDRISKLTSLKLRDLIAGIKQAGDICASLEEYNVSEQGTACSHIGLFELHHQPSSHQRPCWWPSTAQTSAGRPLAGLKIVDLTRIIAAPAITRGLAELGASVLRVTSPNHPDFHGLHPDLNWGKWNAHLDFNSPVDRDTLRTLILDADVVVNGYRPGVLAKHGFGKEEILELISTRERGIIYASVNTYGWYGASQGRPGYQPISDACVGISHGYGQALGLDDGEPVTAVMPTSDYSTGLVGVAAILSALIQRADTGGSYCIDLALSYFNQWLTRCCGAYPEPVWHDLWSRFGKFKFRAHQTMEETAPFVLKAMREKGYLKDEFFHVIHSGALGVDVRCLRPVLQYPEGEVKLRFNVGTRGNGVDQARWPQDLDTEVIT